jgi:alkylation response protein AidB-like acyl-CoA dehydrogenase
VLNGRKQWCTNGSYAAVVMAMFRTGGPGSTGVSAFLVDTASTGLDVEKVTEFAQERSAFGRPIGSFEGISFKIARMATDLEAARLLVYRAAALADAGKPFTLEASQAKLFASTAARDHASEAVQIHGGYGYTTEFPVERYYRDAKITEIYEGTSEIQQLIIARSLLGRL